MNKKLLFGFVFLFLISSVCADLTTDNVLFLKFNNQINYTEAAKDLSPLGNDMVFIGGLNNPSYNSSGFYYDGGVEYTQIPNDASINFGLTDITIEVWIRFSAVANRYIVKHQPGDYNNIGWSLRITGANKLGFEIDDGVDHFDITANTVLTTGHLYHIVVVVDRDDGANSYIYLDNADDTIGRAGVVTDVDDISVANVVTIARDDVPAYVYTNALYSVISMWNRTLSSAEVGQLYGNGSDYDFYPTPPPTPSTNMTINLTDGYDGSSLTDFEAYITNDGYCYQENPTISTTCGGLNTGYYVDPWTAIEWTSTNYKDGDFTTYSQPLVSGGERYIGVIYEIPLGATNTGTLWRVKDGNGEVNLSLSSCDFTDILELRINAKKSVGVDSHVNWQCKISGIYTTLRNSVSTYNVYEEGVYWNTKNYSDSGTGLITTDILNNDTTEYNITIIKNGYFNRTYYDYIPDVSGNLTGEIISTNITFNIMLDGVVLANISKVTVLNVNNSFHINTTTGSINFNPTLNKTWVFQISDNQSLFVPKNFTYRFNGTQNATFNLSVTSINNSATFLYIGDSSAIDGANISIEYPDGNKIYRTTDSQGKVNFSYIYDSSLQIGTYNITLLETETFFTPISFLRSISYIDLPFNLTFLINATHINFTFKDIDTGNYVYNVSLGLIGPSLAGNYTTTPNYYKYFDFLTTGDYDLTMNATGYALNFYYFTVSTRTSDNVTLYLVPTASTTTIDVFVYDENNRLTEGVFIKLLAYDVPTATYILQEMKETNFGGQAQFNVELGTRYYKFILEYPLGTEKLETIGSLIYETTVNLQISLGEADYSHYFSSLNIYGDVSFNNATNNFKFSFNDPEGTISKGCMYVYEDTSLINSSCVLSTTGIIYIPIPATTGKTYLANGFVYFGSTPYFIDSSTYDLLERLEKSSDMLLWVGLFVLLIFLLFRDNITLGLPVAGLPIVLTSAIGLISLPLALAAGIEVLLIIMAIWVSRWQR